MTLQTNSIRELNEAAAELLEPSPLEKLDALEARAYAVSGEERFLVSFYAFVKAQAVGNRDLQDLIARFVEKHPTV